MKIVCVLHEDERILDVARDADYYRIREWEGGQRQEIRLSEQEASRVVQVIMELQRDRRVGDRASEMDTPRLAAVHPFGTERY
jgi:hypothetical protein